ncbi:hypothetical protein HMPREF0556_10531 [Listeria grayi DSM 20601]|uniref:DUF4044 domain-containing protein n=1 Tax=Listeria grayi DSM 20601 TaxID=525367 RepID=D7UW24_LISGR|nr:hypothetical protein HMPREF0556_10531 [Listeria grayi DSM 20601]
MEYIFINKKEKSSISQKMQSKRMFCAMSKRVNRKISANMWWIIIVALVVVLAASLVIGYTARL